MPLGRKKRKIYDDRCRRSQRKSQYVVNKKHKCVRSDTTTLPPCSVTEKGDNGDSADITHNDPWDNTRETVQTQCNDATLFSPTVGHTIPPYTINEAKQREHRTKRQSA
jgi:hypothetical protein